jgi:hypothetical protein
VIKVIKMFLFIVVHGFAPAQGNQGVEHPLRVLP